MRYYDQSDTEVLRQVGARKEGLTSQEAAARLAKNGKNKLKEGKKDSLLKRFFLQLMDPMILILLAAAAVSGALAV